MVQETRMAYFTFKEPDEITNLKVKVIYDEIRKELGLGVIPNVFKSMAINPDVLEANWKKFKATILQGSVPRTLKEMIGIAIAQAYESPYVLNVHLHGLSVLGMSEEVLRTLVTDFAACPLPTREKAVISFGLRAATKPHELTVADYQRLRELGLDESEIFEIVATAELFTGITRYTDAIALEIDTL